MIGTRTASPRHPSRFAAAHLVRHGRLTWPEARTLLAGTTCAWADLDGMHLAPAGDLPEETPCATHLWAWDPLRCLRLRFDTRHALTAALHSTAPSALPSNSVRIRISRGMPWAPEDARVGPLEPDIHTLDPELLELTGATPAVFVRARPL
ncbi:hypothetical protein ACWDBF_08125 [Streptomyces angustmyceticus]